MAIRAATAVHGRGRGRWEVTKGYGGLLKKAERGDDRTAMPLRPFGRNQKKKADEDTSPNATDEFAQFFSSDPRSEPSAQQPAISPTPLFQSRSRSSIESIRNRVLADLLAQEKGFRVLRARRSMGIWRTAASYCRYRWMAFLGIVKARGASM